MPPRMLLVIDGAGDDSPATDLALDWATRLGYGIAAVGLINLEALAPGEMVPPGAGAFKWERDQKRIDDARQHVASSLADLSHRCSAAGVSCHVLSLEENIPGQVLRDAQRCDLLVLCRDLPSELQRLVLRMSPRPLVLAPPGSGQGEDILLAYDASLPAARCTQMLASCQLHRLGTVHVLTVDGRSRERAEAAAALAVDYLASHGIEAHPRALVSDRPVAEILREEATRGPARALAVGAHGRSSFMEFLVGSVTSRLLDDTPVPLFVVH